MATRKPNITRRYQSSAYGKDVIVVYSGLLNGDDGSWFGEPGMVLRSYSVQGAFGASGACAIKCSCVDVTKQIDGFGGTQSDESALTGANNITAAGTVTNGQYTAAPAFRPIVTGGDGTTNLTVTLHFIAD